MTVVSSHSFTFQPTVAVEAQGRVGEMDGARDRVT